MRNLFGSAGFRHLAAVLLIGAVVVLVGGGSALRVAEAQTGAGGAAAAGGGAARFSDPFAYCAAAGTIDAPDARYSGVAAPAVLARSLAVRFDMPNAPAGPAPAVQPLVWRCMAGKVYGCTLGKDVPCTAKADLSRAPKPALLAFCQAHPDNQVIPASVTGHSTVYQWRCAGSAPVVLKQFTRPDAQGYVQHYWAELSANGQ